MKQQMTARFWNNDKMYVEDAGEGCAYGTTRRCQKCDSRFLATDPT